MHIINKKRFTQFKHHLEGLKKYSICVTFEVLVKICMFTKKSRYIQSHNDAGLLTRKLDFNDNNREKSRFISKSNRKKN